MLNPDQISQLKGNVTGQSGGTPLDDSSFQNWLNPVSTPKSNTPSTPGLISNFASNLGSQYSQVPNKISDDISAGAKDRGNGENIGNNIEGMVKTGGRVAGDVAGAVLAPISSGIQTLTDAFRNKNPEIAKVYDSAVAKVADVISNNKDLQDFALKHPNAGEDFGRALNIIMSAGEKGTIEPSTILERTKPQLETGISNIKEGVNTVKDAGQEIAGAVKEKIPTISNSQETNPAIVDRKIVDNFNKGIKPSVVGKSSSGQLDTYNKKVVDAVRTIADNKEKLNITDEFGDSTDKLPENPRQFGQAIGQAKQQIFSQYDALAKSAGGQGAKVELKPVASELQRIVNNPVVQDLHPELAKYAEQRAESLTARGQYTTEEAQSAVQNLNKSLEAYYKNPSYETASKASVDAMIANNLREGLDKSITNIKGEGYAGLKSKYASLKAIEKDVNKRTQMVARKTTGGLQFGDVFSAEEVIRGLSTMNPQAIATGVGVKAATTLWKYFNNPDRYIKSMFNSVGEATSKGKSGL